MVEENALQFQALSVYIEKMREAMLTRKVSDSTKALKAVDRVVWGNLKARGAGVGHSA